MALPILVAESLLFMVYRTISLFSGLCVQCTYSGGAGAFVCVV